MTRLVASSCAGLALLACSSPSDFVPSNDDADGAAGSGGVAAGGNGGAPGGGGSTGGGGLSAGGSGSGGGGGSGAGGGGGSGGGCASPKTECTKGGQTVCTDTASDDANCGACNNVCPAGSSCKGSSCACTDATKTFCKQGGSGLCVNVKTDPQNCGSCGKKCPNSNCTAGECDKVVFVTKNSYSTNLGGVTGADGICASDASKAGLKGTFKAWISDGVVAPTNSFKKSNTPYVLSDGTTKVAESFAALGAGVLQHAITKAEDKTPIAGKTVMTNVKADGSVATASFTCNGWSNTASTEKFFGGSTDSTSVTWTDGSAGAVCTASALYHLYCFEQ